MLDIFDQLTPWVEAATPFALATVVDTWGSAPRLVGASMAISRDLDILGSVSGGCVEGAVIKEAQQRLSTGEPVLLRYGIANEDAWSVGLSCGGKLTVLLTPFPQAGDLQAEWKAMQRLLAENRGGAWLRAMPGTARPAHAVLAAGEDTSLPDELRQAAEAALKQRKSQVLELADGAYFANVIPRKSQLLVIGAAHITVDLVHLARYFGFETTVIDPRGIFADHTQFITPPDHLHQAWPEQVLPDLSLDAFTYAVMLTHDPKIDDQALRLLLRSEAAYIGALGSRRTHARRVKRLEEAGFEEEAIGRIHAPVGVDIRAKLPREIALSIVAEMVSVKNQFL